MKKNSNHRYNILVVDDEVSQRELLTGALIKEGYQVVQAGDLPAAKQAFQNNLIDLVITDQKLDKGQEGINLLKFCKKINPEIPVVLITAYGDIENAVSAMKLGAFYYLTKPIALDELLTIINKAIDDLNIIRESRLIQDKYLENLKEYPIIAESLEMKNILSIVSRIAPYPISVLITGESGVGKEVVARLIHCSSPRGTHPFIAVNCSAIPETLLEAELFGVEKGAYTGAHSSRKGRFELADQGTIFLDEIGDVSPAIQVKLLRVLADKSFVRLGGEKVVKVDVKVIAATNQNLEEKIKTGTFREDLFYRLNVVAIDIPPLRERKDDIGPLADQIMNSLRSKMPEKKDIRISWEAQKILIKHHWQGNIRQLENTLHRAFVLCRGDLIGPEDLDIYPQDEDLSLEWMERKHIARVLKITGGNIQKASNLLKIHRNTLREKINKYGLN
jgi:DNA-binding NtrC family response regulator